MKNYCLLLFSFFTLNVLIAQSYTNEILKFQQELNNDYKDPKKSPLDAQDLANFVQHEFFPINEKFKVVAKIERLETPKAIDIKTSTARKPDYNVYGIATFTLDAVTYKLSLLQSASLSANPEYADYLFLPFYDNTNCESTYCGGRYIDLKIPEGDFITIDFNKAYHPYCAYSKKYSCPIPPAENSLDVSILAGIRLSQVNTQKD